MPPRRAKRQAAAPAAPRWTRQGGRLVRRAPDAPAAVPAALSALQAVSSAAELLPLFLILLPPVEIVTAQLVCREWRDAARNPAVWAAADLSLASTFCVRVDPVRLRAQLRSADAD
jgi:hypothetical protein